MALEIQGKPGPVLAQDGVLATARLSRDAAVVTQDAHGRYQEAVYRGNVYAAASQAGVTSQAGLSATTPTLVLYNPTGNTKNLVLLYASATYTVSAATAGVIWLAASVPTAAAQGSVTALGTANTLSFNMLLGSANKPSGAILLASTLGAAPVGIAILGALITGAITTSPEIQTFGRFFDGTVILTPNSAVSIQTGVASGAAGQFCEFIWEEIPFP